MCVCSCVIKLLVNAACTNKLLPVRDMRTLLRQCVCDVARLSCCSGECEVCKDVKMVDSVPQPAEMIVSYMRWETVKNSQDFKVAKCIEVR